MSMRKIPVGVILVIAMTVIAVSVLATSLLMARLRVPNVGNVKAVGVGVYWNSACTSNVTSIDWGFLEPGAIVNITVYIKNEGNIPVMLNMTTDNWNPTLDSNNITVSWNREEHVLDSESVVQAVLVLSVSSDINGVTDFSFDIIVTGTEYA